MPGTHRTQLAVAYIAIVAALAGNVGCRAPQASDFKPSNLFSLDSGWPWGEDESEEGTPVRVVGTWTDTVLHHPGQKPQRGFGGRLLFYEKKDDKPILVDGQLVVYAFDETGRDPTDNKPTRRYVFPPDQISRHMSMSEIGASYSFWLPWDEAGGPRTEVSLICRFEPKGGAVITGEQTKHLLPGPVPLQSETAARQLPQLPEGVPSRPARPTLEGLQTSRRTDGGTQLASYESPVDAPAAATHNNIETTSLVPERRMSVTSIKLPDSFNLRAAAGGAISPPATPGGASVLPQSQPQAIQQQPAAPNSHSVATNPGIKTAPMRPAASAWQTAPAMPTQNAGGFGSRQLARPQLLTPQLMTLQPAPVTPAAAPTISYPQPATSAQPAAR